VHAQNAGSASIGPKPRFSMLFQSVEKTSTPCFLPGRHFSRSSLNVIDLSIVLTNIIKSFEANRSAKAV
jgi:hypothetical protein